VCGDFYAKGNTMKNKTIKEWINYVINNWSFKIDSLTGNKSARSEKLFKLISNDLFQYLIYICCNNKILLEDYIDLINYYMNSSLKAESDSRELYINLNYEFPNYILKSLVKVVQVNNKINPPPESNVVVLLVNTFEMVGYEIATTIANKEALQRHTEYMKIIDEYVEDNMFGDVRAAYKIRHNPNSFKWKPTSYEKKTIESTISKDIKTIEAMSTNENKETSDITIEELVNDIYSLVGLNGVKQEIKSLVNLYTIRKIREERNIKQPSISNHLIFTGNPGTGKTTIARMLAMIYKKLNILSKGHLIEVDRSGLVSNHVGETALKVKEVIDNAMGGILFIDEAYSLYNQSEVDFGREAIDTLLKAMEDNRSDLIVIVAGYSNEMENFLDYNPGLRSRFNRKIVFDDYSVSESVQIFNDICKKDGFVFDSDVLYCVEEYFLHRINEDDYANARDVRNYYEKSIMNQANRLANKSDISDHQLITLIKEDVINIKLN
jgi:SpoVK/Ycf46/Vps4 family AAA+-type ATPase